MTFEELKEKVIKWADDKDLLHIRNADKQFMKFIEEVFEFKTEMDNYVVEIKQDEYSNDYKEYITTSTMLEVGDIFVTLIILCEQLNISPEKCLEMAYTKISTRTGKTINGTFVKEEDLEKEEK